MLTEESRSITVTATAEKDGYKYSVNYSTKDSNLISLHCNVYKKISEEVTTSTGTQTVEREEYIGIMFQESGNKQSTFPQDTDITPHIAVFEEILEEVKAGLINEKTQE